MGCVTKARREGTLRNIIRLCLVVAATMLVDAAAAQTNRTTPMRMLAGFPPGGNVDILARIFAERLTESLGRPVVVLNKPGAGGQIAAELLKESPPDGDTLLMTPDAALVARPLTMTRPPYDPLVDFAPVAQTGAQDYAMAIGVHIPPKTLREFAAWAKANPDGAHFGSSGEGGMTHFIGLLIGDAIGTPLRQVPYAGSGPAVTALATGQISSTIQPLGTMVAQAQAGSIRLVALSGTKRAAAFPDVPTLTELGYPSVVATSWFGIFAPPRTPPETVAKFNELIIGAMRTDKVKDQMRNLALDINELTPAQFAALLKTDVERWTPVIKASGFKVEVR
jgi:tripartite-type tricarboxylate transporter receptor subunit TctC